MIESAIELFSKEMGIPIRVEKKDLEQIGVEHQELINRRDKRGIDHYKNKISRLDDRSVFNFWFKDRLDQIRLQQGVDEINEETKKRIFANDIYFKGDLYGQLSVIFDKDRKIWSATYEGKHPRSLIIKKSSPNCGSIVWKGNSILMIDRGYDDGKENPLRRFDQNTPAFLGVPALGLNEDCEYPGPYKNFTSFVGLF